tara:strand:+ start:50 stop:1183 length:1134 start_codon:yes stop_codon:yes gene_type:complete
MVKQEHRDLLARTGWYFGKPLPLGNCHYTVTDFLMLNLMFNGWSYLSIQQFSDHFQEFLHTHLGEGSTLVFTLGIALTCFMIVMGHWFNALFSSRIRSNHIMLLLALPPLIFYPHFNIYMACLALLGIYIVCVCMINYNLKHFIWEEPYYDKNPIKRLQDEAARSKMILGAMKRLSPRMTNKVSSIKTKLLLTLLICWWIDLGMTLVRFMFLDPDQNDLHYQIFGTWSRAAYYDESPSELLDMQFITAVYISVIPIYIMNLIYIGQYILRWITAAPIQVYSRPLNFHWLIRKYDAMLLVPITITAYTALMSWMLYHHWLHPRLFLYVTMIGMVLIEYIIGPSKEKWFFTWNHAKFLGSQPAIKKKAMGEIEISFDLE